MAGGVVARMPNTRIRTRVKTGCATCRIRRIKCDETKPSCQKCVKTGRTCDGYDSPFRHCTTSQTGSHVSMKGPGKPIDRLSSGKITPGDVASGEIASHEVDLLNRYFSTKTVFNVKLGCDEEARQVLKASLGDPSIRHAVSSLIALREDLEASKGTTSDAQHTSTYQHGLQQYGMALGGLASHLSTSNSNILKSALFCCQIFISIEQVQGNYASMAEHIIRGFKIMHEYRARPALTAEDVVLPAYHEQLPFVDVFVIKLFAAPCKFAEPSAAAAKGVTTPPGCPLTPPVSPPEQQSASHSLRPIAPDMRTKLTSIAASILDFLDAVSRFSSLEHTRRLLSKKKSLMESLETWLKDLEAAQVETGLTSPEPISVCFLRFFHIVLKVVLVGALDSSPSLNAELQTANNRLQGIAENVGERLRDYKMQW